MMRVLYAILIMSFLISGCNPYKQDGYKEYYVVESYLVANRTLPEVLLTKTVPIEGKYSYQDALIKNAQVQIRLLKADSTVEKRYNYKFASKGSYRATNPALVNEQSLYQLFITLPNGDNIEAKTYVPGDFKTLNKNEFQDSFVYQSDRQVEVKTTPSLYITNRQTYYIFTVNATDPDSSKLTPFYKDLVIDQENDIQNFSINSSGIINESNYNKNADSTITLKLPWISIAFYGTNDVVANAIDDNMYDFLRTQSVQTGGISISPGQIQNIRYHVNGGVGIFGSLASDTNRVDITRRKN